MSPLRALVRRAMLWPALALPSRCAAGFARVDHLARATGPARHPFVVCLTIDVESGYLRRDLGCVWADVEPRALQGFVDGVPLLVDIAREAGVPLSFLASPQGFIARGDEARRVERAFERVLAEGHELGLHLHPRTDEVLHAELGRRLEFASAHFYELVEQVEMLLASRRLIREHLGHDAESSLRSFRWGNWALGPATVAALERAGFELDSSALPGKRDHAGSDRFYDWSRLATRRAFRMCRGDYQDCERQDSSVLELPVATFDLFGARIADATRGPLLEEVVAHYHRCADRSREPFVFVASLHSPEVVFADGSPAPTAAAVARWIERTASLPDVRFATLAEAAALVRAPGARTAALSPSPA